MGPKFYSLYFNTPSSSYFTKRVDYGLMDSTLGHFIRPIEWAYFYSMDTVDPDAPLEIKIKTTKKNFIQERGVPLS